MKNLDKKVIIIAGGATGLGAATAKRLAAEGAKVLVGDINMAKAEKTVGGIRKAGGEAEAFEFDISKPDDCKALVEAAKSKWGRVNGLYNAAADLSQNTLGRDSNVVEMPLEVLYRTIEVDMYGFFYTCRFAIPAMIESGGGSIVSTISSATLTQPNYVAYGMAKKGIIALTQHISNAYSKQGIRANAIDPGITLTENQLEMVTEELRAQILPGIRNTRFGEPEDIAAMVAFLMSDECTWINGQMYPVSSMDGAR